MHGISIRPRIGVGDALQFSSVPENYFKATGARLIDVTKPWFFDHNPYVVRDPETPPKTVREMWNFGPTQYQWPKIEGRKQDVYLSNAEISAAVWNVPTVLNRPRLYRFEDFPFGERSKILLHVDGVSHGVMPEHVLNHVLKKYVPTGRLHQIGLNVPSLGVPVIRTETLWDLAKVISEASMLICVDSGPSWIAACYPDVVVKKLRTKPTPENFKTWVPLAYNNIHSYWDDRCHQIFNPSEEDVGFTTSYKKI